MRRSRLIGVLAVFAAVGMFAAEASAMYHPGTGRFMQRDPGTGSAVHIGYAGPVVSGRFVPRDTITQYADGMNLYQFARSAPNGIVDPSGLKSEVYVECRLVGSDPDSKWYGWLYGIVSRNVHCSVIASCDVKGKEEALRFELGGPGGKTATTTLKSLDHGDKRWVRYEVARTNDLPDQDCCWFDCLKRVAGPLLKAAPTYEKLGPNSNTYANVLLERCGFKLKPRNGRWVTDMWDPSVTGEPPRHWEEETEPAGATGWGYTKPWEGRGPTDPVGAPPSGPANNP